MTASSNSLWDVFEGWEGYQTSLLGAVSPLSRDQLTWRPAPHLRSVGELARHITFARVNWFLRMGAPGSREVAQQIDAWVERANGSRYVNESAFTADRAADLVRWLGATWQMIEQTLKSWTVDDLWQTYRSTWRDNTYAISRQWTIWHIMAHDIQHGGELVVMLGMQGLQNVELGDLGGHIATNPIVD
jgi:uncharacterized damage-inducible protein DinB